MENNITQFEELSNKPKRPQLLTVLCILSFIMCALGVLSGIFNLYQTQPDVMQKNIEQVRAVSPEMADQMENQMIAMDNNAFMKIYPYLNFIFILLSFMGVLMMWNLKRNGFYLYSIAEILPYSSMIFMDKDAMKIPGLPAGSMMVGMVIMIAIDVLFVFLYSRNLKEMNS
jgi:hypothetical protein